MRRVPHQPQTYYKWLDRWLRYGPEGLKPHDKRQPTMPNRLSPVVEQANVDYIAVWPTHGPRRIANELRSESWGGIVVSHWGVYKTLGRRQLHRRGARLRRYELLQARATGILTEHTRQLLTMRPAPATVQADHPGDLVGVDTFRHQDRFLHHADVVVLSGESYRLRETRTAPKRVRHDAQPSSRKGGADKP